jgi:outer membrane protein
VRTTKLGRSVTTIATATLATALWAAAPQYPVSSAAGQQTRGAHLGAPEMRLGLQDAIATALQHNINLEVSRLGLASAQQNIFANTGIFDPVLKLDAGGTVANEPATSELVGAVKLNQRTRTFDLSVGELLPTGATIGLGFTDTRTKTNSSFYFLNPSYSAGLEFSISQPLLAGFGTDVNRAAIEVARRNRDISRVQFSQIVITTVQAVEGAYWNLVYAIDGLQVKKDSLKLAQDLLDQTRTRVRIGTSAPIDIVQSEATVAAREEDIILAENAVENAADILKGLMGFENPGDWESHITPVDALEVMPKPVALDAAIEEGLHRRVELKQRELELQIGETNALVARNATRPQLNLALGYGLAGVGGDETLTDQNGNVILTAPGSWDDALRQIYHADFKQWSGTVSFSYPLGNHQARAQLAQRRYDVAIARQNLALQRQSVISDVRNAVRALEAGTKSIAAAVKARELAERNLDAEEKKFANGMSTNFQVLKIQDDLAAARNAELQARVGYRQAAVTYQVAVGSLLDAMGVEITDRPAPKEPHTALSNVSWLKFAHWLRPEKSAPLPTPAPKP